MEKRIHNEAEAIAAWNLIVKDVMNTRNFDADLMAELQSDWTSVIAPKVKELQDRLTKWAVAAKYIQQSEVDRINEERRLEKYSPMQPVYVVKTACRGIYTDDSKPSRAMPNPLNFTVKDCYECSFYNICNSIENKR